MSSLAEHPTVKRFHELNDAAIASSRIQGKDQISEKLEAEWLRQLCLEAGADDVAKNLMLDAVILAEETYLDGIWGKEKIYDREAKPISWPAIDTTAKNPGSNSR